VDSLKDSTLDLKNNIYSELDVLLQCVADVADIFVRTYSRPTRH